MGHLLLTERLKQNVGALTSESWMQYFWLFLITLAAAALRIYKLGDWSFWIDEIFTVNHALAHFSTPKLILEHLPPNRNWVPISVILTAQAFNAWGVNELSARLTAAVIGIITVPVLYFPTRKMFNTRVALITMLLLAVSPWHIDWSQNARFYTSLMFFYSLALFVFYIAIEKDRPHYFILFYILFYLAMSERLIAVLLIPVIFIFIIMIKFLPFEHPPGLNARNILILSAPIILFLLYEFYLFATTGDYIFASDLDLLASPIDNPVRILIIVAFSVGIPILCFGFFSGISLLFMWDRAGLFILIAAILPPVVIALASPFFFIVERYAFVALLFWITLGAIGIKSIFTMAGRYGISLALGILSIFLVDAGGDNLLYYQINQGNRLEWREATEHIRREINDGDIIISTRAPLAAYYLDEDILEFQGLSPEDLEMINSPIWFIVDYPGVWHGQNDTKVWMEKHAQLLQFSFLRIKEENTLLIYYLDPIMP